MASELDIRPLTPERLTDLASLFEQGGDPKWCWCAYFRIRGFDFSKGGKARHRAAMEAATHETAREDRAPGLVAYDGGEAVGWISIGPREDYERLAHSTVLKPLDEKPVWSIVCFVVGRRSRGQGVARRLLDAGVDYARDHGATMLEAYPVEIAEGRRATSIAARWRCSNEPVSRSSSGARLPAAHRARSSAARYGDDDGVADGGTRLLSHSSQE
jgi:GNAT superfamily N-acetyltransferase